MSHTISHPIWLTYLVQLFLLVYFILAKTKIYGNGGSAIHGDRECSVGLLLQDKYCKIISWVNKWMCSCMLLVSLFVCYFSLPSSICKDCLTQHYLPTPKFIVICKFFKHFWKRQGVKGHSVNVSQWEFLFNLWCSSIGSLQILTSYDNMNTMKCKRPGSFISFKQFNKDQVYLQNMA